MVKDMATCDVNIVQNALGIQQTGPRTVIVPADPIIWSAKRSYEYLTLVASADFGQAYISKRDVPAGTSLTNTDYWIPAAQYNAQLAEIQRNLAAIAPDVEEAFDAIDYTGKKLTLFGDSTFLANGDGDGRTTNGVTSYISAMCNVEVDNRAVSGYLLNDILTQVNGLAAFDSDYIVVAAGTNNFRANTALLRFNNEQSVYQLVRDIVTKLRSLCPSASINVVTPAFVYDPNFVQGGNVLGPTGIGIHEFCDVMEAAAHEAGAGCTRLDMCCGVTLDNYTTMMLKTPSAQTFVHYADELCWKIARLMVSRSFMGTDQTPFDGGDNLIYDQSRYSSGKSTFGNSVQVVAISSTNPTLHFESRNNSKTLYVSGLIWGTGSITYNGEVIATITQPGYFCVPFVMADNVNEISFTSSALLSVQVTSSRNNPALIPNKNSDTLYAYTTKYGSIIVSGGSVKSIRSSLINLPTTINNGVFMTLEGWVHGFYSGCGFINSPSFNTPISYVINESGQIILYNLSKQVENATNMYLY